MINLLFPAGNASWARTAAYFLTVLCGPLLAGCGGGEDSAPTVPPPPSEASFGLRIEGSAMVKLRFTGSAAVVMTEVLTAHASARQPQRLLNWADLSGNLLRTHAPPDDWHLNDFAVHPSGHTSAIYTAPGRVMLIRFGAQGERLSNHLFSDPLVSGDPHLSAVTVDPQASASLVSTAIRDATRVAALGEDVAAAIRTGRNAVVAYRFRFQSAGFAQQWRRLVEPGAHYLPVSLISGSFDPFGQLTSHLRTHIDTDAAGNVWVAVGKGIGYESPVTVHSLHFGEAFPGHEFFHGSVLLTRVSGDGSRLGTTLLNTFARSDLNGLRVIGGTVFLLGRVQSDPASSRGWDGFIAQADVATGRLTAYEVLDIQGGDALFDVARGSTGLIAAGVTDYEQNPAGASVSEASRPVLVALSDAGRIVRRLEVSTGPRHNVLLFIERMGSRHVYGGYTNGPGTHSGDGDPGLIRADGFVTSRTF